MEENRSKAEEKIIKFWKKNQIFEKSLKKEGGDFVFYEGPPTANGKPGIHHVLARAYKDIICRYQAMNGKRVLRKAGWDVHGLPVELSVEKELGLRNKKEIEEYGIDKFNQKCKESVWKYAQDWTTLTERIGYWLDLKDPYITSDPFYMESIFNIIKQISNKGLLHQDYKVIPYCPRCGTGLSSHEVAQGYKNIKESAIYVKFKIKDKKFIKDTHLLVWTTTPWTLPGNVAVAVNPKITYILVKINKEHLILAKERQSILEADFKVIKEFKGEELVGLDYKSLFTKKIVSFIEKPKNIYKILPADFVTTDEGTGLVHIAPAFGQEDMELIKAQDGKFPILLTVDEQGKFKSEVKEWDGKFVKQANPLITKYLEKTGFLFAEEQYEHDYPFCWRCDTPLLYYAKKSWFIKTTAVKDLLIKNNKEINWTPEHIKEGRFGEWLNGLRDWALSRERYWGTPLPVWKCSECDHQEVIGSREDLIQQTFSNNRFFTLRHGEALSNAEEFYCSWPELKKSPLTKKGRADIKEVAQKLKEEKIDLIFSSDVLRTSQTAEIVAKELDQKIEYDERLREIDTGILNNKNIQEGREFFNPKNKLKIEEVLLNKFKNGFPEGENFSDIRIRILDFIKDIDRRYKNKKILIVSHQIVITILKGSLLGWTKKESVEHRKEVSTQTGQFDEVGFKLFPYNEKAELDFHRPYIDEIQFLCPKCKKPMKRVSEVIDCWFDSGSMPFAQHHWPFNEQLSTTNKHLAPPELFPADYISEAIDQTRGWFYTLLAISSLLGFESPYKNVIVLGHLLDKKGQKMSKSKGNVVDPWEMIEKYGADALRWYTFVINQPWDPKLFDEKDLDQQLKKFIMTFWHSYTFWKTYTKGLNVFSDPIEKIQKSNNILDKWILSKLNRLIKLTTEKLNEYDITSSVRLIDDFVINDLSLWYIRRSRTRFQKPDSEKELKEASSVLGYILFILTRLTAPFTPFISEEIYLGLTNGEFKQSVHLESWPRVNEKLINNELEEKMNIVRGIVSTGLKIRNEEGIKVRQPLNSLKIKSEKFSEELFGLIQEELNVKSIEFTEDVTKGNGWKLEYDLKITAELLNEGIIREVTRKIQGMRKKVGCKPEDKITIYYHGDESLTNLLANNAESILLQTRAKDFILQRKEKQSFNIEKQFKINNQEFWLGLKL
ncbi:MAG: class I tRNA ligase family protein [Patescibacteria group bacterium]|nr:class I tRNA ligase family protein [Patescibacteria group bacterium]